MGAAQRILIAGFLATAIPAWAELDVVVANGDLVRGTLLPATQVETFRVRCPAGARLAVKLRSGRTGAGLVARVFDASGVELASRRGRRIALRGIAATTSGEYRIEVSTDDGVTSSDYRFVAGWRSQRRAEATVSVDANSAGTLTFAADARAAVRLRTAPAPGSAAVPALLRVDGPDGFSLGLPAAHKGEFVAPVTGTYSLTFENQAAVGGDVVARASIRAPRVRGRRLAATTAEIPPGTDVRASVVIGADGGAVEATSGALDGTTVLVPVGALVRPAIVVIGTSADLTPPKPTESTLATPAVFVGPVGTTFAGATRPRVALPAQTVAAIPVGAGLQVFAARVAGAVEVVQGASYDGEAVDFEPARLTAFQGYFVEQPEIPAPFVGADAGTRPLAAVALGGGFAFVGSPYAAASSPGAINSGAVLVYERVGTTWALRQTLEAPSPAEADYFGWALAYRRSPLGPEDDSLLVSAERQQPTGFLREGKIYEFVATDGTWHHRTTLTSGVPGKDGFGFTFEADEDRLVAPVADEILVLRRDAQGWGLDQRVAAPTWAGSAVAFRGGSILVGVAYDYSLTNYHPPGSVYRFEPSGATWSRALRYAAPAPEEGRNAYGSGVALGDEFVAAAMPNSGATGAPDRPMDVLVHRRSDGALDATIVRPIDPNLGSDSPELTGEMKFRGDALFLAARDDATFAGAYEFRRSSGTWERERTFDAGPYVGAGARSRPLTGALAIDGSSLAITVGVYDYDLRTTQYAVVLFDAP